MYGVRSTKHDVEARNCGADGKLPGTENRDERPLRSLKENGYRASSVTIDGRRASDM